MKISTLIKILFTIYCFATLSFFQPFGLVSPESAKAVSYLFMFAIFALAIMCSNDDGLLHQTAFKGSMKWFIFFILFSTIMPTLTFAEQSIPQSIVATIPYLSYGLYFALRKFNIEWRFFVRLAGAISVIAILTHIINVNYFPITIFGTPAEEYDTERGGLRLIIIGFNFLVLLFFVAASQIKHNKGAIWWIPFIASYLMIIFSYTRQHIFVCTLLGAAILISKVRSIVGRILLILFVCGCALVVVPQMGFFQKLTNLTIEQIERDDSMNRENVRIVAAKYYGWEGFDNHINRFLGNGVPSFHSRWGTDFKNMTELEHIFAADVGWFGLNWHFGIFAVIAMLAVCIKAISRKNAYSTAGRFYFIWLLGTSFMSGSLLYQYEIVVTVIALCMIDYQNEKKLL